MSNKITPKTFEEVHSHLLAASAQLATISGEIDDPRVSDARNHVKEARALVNKIENEALREGCNE